jgi:heat shock protein HtpX
MFNRIFLFVATNIAILVVISIILAILSKVFGIDLSGSSYGGMMVASIVIGFG